MKYLLAVLFSILSVISCAQQDGKSGKSKAKQVKIERDKSGIDYTAIFSTSHIYVGIPQGDSLCIFGTQRDKWKKLYSFKIPDNTVAMDGNERRVFFLTDKEMIIQEYYLCVGLCDRDSIRLNEIEADILPKHWLRNTNSSEKDFVYFSKNKLAYKFKEDNQWKTTYFHHPFQNVEKTNSKSYLDLPYQKISVYDDNSYLITQENQYLKFWIFDPMNALEESPQQINEMTPVETLHITLPQEILSFFVYDNKELGWVYKDRIEFYGFDKEKSAWIKSLTPELKFENLK